MRSCKGLPFFCHTSNICFLPTCPLGDFMHFYFLLLKFFVMINGQLSAIVSNISLQLKVKGIIWSD